MGGKRIHLAALMLVLAPIPSLAEPMDAIGPGTGRNADGVRLELDILGGAIAPLGWNDTVVGGHGALDLRASWPVGRNIRLGLRAGLGIGGIEWQCARWGDHLNCWPDRLDPDEYPDGIYPYGVQPTLIFQGAFLVAIDPATWFTLELTTGFGTFAPAKELYIPAIDWDGPWAAIPLPAIGLGATFRLGGTRFADIGITTRLDVLIVATAAVLMPQAGLTIRF